MKQLLILIFTLSTLIGSAQSSCDFFEDVNITIEKTNLNTRGSDFGPAIVNNELWYSAFTEKEIQKILRGSTRKIFYNLYNSPLDLDGNVLDGKMVQLEELSADYHAGPVSYCRQTKELYVTLSNYKNPDVKYKVFQKADIRLKIVILKNINGVWKLMEELPFNHPKYSVGHPAISQTGDTLFFASNIPNFGSGATDLYMSVRKNGKWVDWVNLGETVNTAKNDMFPVLYKNNMLIYASDGKEDSEGGLDLYYTCLNESGFSSPENLRRINSKADDFSLTIHANNEIGYFTSKRSGGNGDDDIYKIRFEKPMIAKREITGLVIDDAMELPIADARVSLLDCKGNVINNASSSADGTFSFLVEPGQCLEAKAAKQPYYNDKKAVEKDHVILRLKGDYELELLVRDKNTLEKMPGVAVNFNDKMVLNTNTEGLVNRDLERNSNYVASSHLEGYMNQSVAISTIGVPFGTIRDTINIEKAIVGQKFTLENIFYDFDKWDILPESRVELNKLVKILNDNPSWKVELGSHTDSRGSDSYNELLSQKRSDSAVRYIIAKGIYTNRIVAKGYGESQLVNQCANGVVCSDKEHRKNRRTEFKILDM